MATQSYPIPALYQRCHGTGPAAELPFSTDAVIYLERDHHEQEHCLREGTTAKGY